MNLSEHEKTQIHDLLGRTPTDVEWHIFDTMWSEHCSYKSSKNILKKYLPTTGSEVALGIGEDSGIIRFATHNGKQYCIAVSHESHNHPSQVLPIEGAATGVGGVVRDVYCMGADVVGVLNSLHFGINEGDNPIVDEIAEKVVYGVSDYANPLGVPVLGGETLYHSSYNDNCLVNVAALGLLEEDHIIHSYVPKAAASTPYDVILVGKSTDATGFGGASFSSATLDADNQTANIGAVQVHDPFLKRVLVEAIKDLINIVNDKNIDIGFKDLGAGGIACATSELAVAGNLGVRVNLDRVNVAMSNLPPEVIACSETQERFCLMVPKSFTNDVLRLFNETYQMPQLYPHSGAVVIGETTSEKCFVLTHEGNVVCDLAVEAITTDVEAHREMGHRDIPKSPEVDPELKGSVAAVCEQVLAQKNAISKRYVYRYFDNAVRGDTVLYPGEADAVVTTPINGSNVGLTASMDSNLYGHHDPYISGAAAVAEAVRNVISVGGSPIAVTDCLNYGNPEKPDVLFDFKEGVRGIADACHALGFIDGESLPVISGNVSLYNESKQGNAVVPSPVIVVIGRVNDYRLSRSMQIKESDDVLFLVGKRYAEFAGTEISRYLTSSLGQAPQVRFDEEARQNKAVFQIINESLASACHDISVGGTWTTLVEMCLGERGYTSVGLEIQIPEDVNEITWLFSENGGYVVSVPMASRDNVCSILKNHDCYFEEIGRSISDKEIIINKGQERIATLELDSLNQARETINNQRIN